MDRIIVKGGAPLRGSVHVSGSKNSALPILAACLLTDELCVVRRVPNLSDTRFMGEILAHLGSDVAFKDGTMRIRATKCASVAPYDLVRKMRASVCLLGPMLARLKDIKVSMPGGCVIGPRPIDIHLKGMRSLGATTDIDAGYVHIWARELRGARMFLGGRFGTTVLGTDNVMMAAVLARGTTVIESAACEPEVVDLANFLNKMGAHISGAGSPTITIQGVSRLHGAEYTVIPDRIEAGTFVVAAAAAGGQITVKGANAGHLGALFDKLEESGVSIDRRSGGDIVVKRERPLKSVDVITMPYAGFPTDLQAQMMVLMSVTPNISVITEKIFPDRYMHVSELARMGADIALEGSTAIVKGVKTLKGAPVMASDLRASAALVIAGMIAKGRTEINRVYHIDRGYEKIDDKLRGLGAKIERVSDKAIVAPMEEAA
ncbi:MAG: UDP-N-acetylglucosamine 1-carboxyvinyltransferase [Verrucomicrobiae bacterium]|nr:UDP-N-acetylglucosamine 1-carboxyvinyltransferase [Verrucomicrobiae bacterium]